MLTEHEWWNNEKVVDLTDFSEYHNVPYKNSWAKALNCDEYDWAVATRESEYELYTKWYTTKFSKLGQVLE